MTARNNLARAALVSGNDLASIVESSFIPSENLLMIVLCVMYLLWLSGEPTVPAIPVEVVVADGITDSLAHRICAEAETIWRPAGITFDWHITFDRHRIKPADAPHHSAVSITIGNGRAEAAPDGALGWI